MSHEHDNLGWWKFKTIKKFKKFKWNSYFFKRISKKLKNFKKIQEQGLKPSSDHAAARLVTAMLSETVECYQCVACV